MVQAIAKWATRTGHRFTSPTDSLSVDVLAETNYATEGGIASVEFTVGAQKFTVFERTTRTPNYNTQRSPRTGTTTMSTIEAFGITVRATDYPSGVIKVTAKVTSGIGTETALPDQIIIYNDQADGQDSRPSPKVIYVNADTGDNANPGTAGAPVLSIVRAVQLAATNLDLGGAEVVLQPSTAAHEWARGYWYGDNLFTSGHWWLTLRVQQGARITRTGAFNNSQGAPGVAYTPLEQDLIIRGNYNGVSYGGAVRVLLLLEDPDSKQVSRGDLKISTQTGVETHLYVEGGRFGVPGHDAATKPWSVNFLEDTTALWDQINQANTANTHYGISCCIAEGNNRSFIGYEFVHDCEAVDWLGIAMQTTSRNPESVVINSRFHRQRYNHEVAGLLDSAVGGKVEVIKIGDTMRVKQLPATNIHPIGGGVEYTGTTLDISDYGAELQASLMWGVRVSGFANAGNNTSAAAFPVIGYGLDGGLPYLDLENPSAVTEASAPGSGVSGSKLECARKDIAAGERYRDHVHPDVWQFLAATTNTLFYGVLVQDVTGARIWAGQETTWDRVAFVNCGDTYTDCISDFSANTMTDCLVYHCTFSCAVNWNPSPSGTISGNEVRKSMFDRTSNVPGSGVLVDGCHFRDGNSVGTNVSTGTWFAGDPESAPFLLTPTVANQGTAPPDSVYFSLTYLWPSSGAQPTKGVWRDVGEDSQAALTDVIATGAGVRPTPSAIGAATVAFPSGTGTGAGVRPAPSASGTGSVTSYAVTGAGAGARPTATAFAVGSVVNPSGESMTSTHYYGLLGDIHTRGTRTSQSNESGTARPLILGPSEFQLELFDIGASLGTLAVNDVLQQVASALAVTIRCRVIRIVSNDLVQATVVAEPVAADHGSLIWPTVPADDPAYAWDTYGTSGAVDILRNGANTTWQVTRATSGQTIEQLNDANLESVTSDTVYWDPAAKLAQTLDIDGYSHTPNSDYILPGDFIATSGGATFTVVGVEVLTASTARLSIVKVSGTLTVGHTLTNNVVNRSVSGVSITSVGAATTAGAWVRYCPTPSLNRSVGGAANDLIANEWEIPPNGNGGKSGVAGLGPDANIIPRAIAYHAQAPSGDRGVRFHQYNANDDDTDAFRAGVTYQRVTVTGQTGAWAENDTVTAGTSGWSATVAGTNGAGVVYVVSPNGVTLQNGEALTTSSGGTATSTGAADGWQKGSSFWNNWKASKDAAMAAPNALDNGAAALWEGLFLMVWEGEIGAYGALGTPFGLLMLSWAIGNQETVREQWVNWARDLRTELGNDDLPLALWIHHPKSQENTLGGAPSVAVRTLFKSLPTYIDNLTIVDSYDRGHQMQQADDGGSYLYLRTMDYVDLGTAFWHLALEPTIIAPVGDYRVLPVIVIAGSQSQMRGFNSYAGIKTQNRDPELYPTLEFDGPNGLIFSTLDPNVLSWNFASEELQVYDVAKNENTFWQSLMTVDQHGPCPSLIQRMKMRFGDGTTSSPICLFKAAISGSAYNRNVNDAPACWDPTLEARPVIGPVSSTVTIINIGSLETPSWRARITASAGTFSSITSVPMTVVISGGAGQQSAGGNNTNAFDSNLVRAVAGDGSYIDVDAASAAQFNATTESLSIAVGPPPAWPEFRRQWKTFVRKASEAGWVVHPVALITDQGESDISLSGQYAAELDKLWTGFTETCALRNAKGDVDVAKCIVMLHGNSPFSVDREAIDVIRAKQAAKASSLTNCVLVDPTDLALEAGAYNPATQAVSSPAFPRQFRLENGIHLTGRDMITKGYLIDKQLATLSTLIPSHPSGDAVTVGAVNGSASLELVLDDVGGDGGGEDVPSSPNPAGGLVIEIGQASETADSYVSVADAEAIYLAKYGVPASWTAATTAQKEQALRRACTEYLEGLYSSRWRGAIQTQDQRLSWPRYGAQDDAGRVVPISTVPDAIREAQSIVAADIIAGGEILPTGYQRGEVVRETKKGADFEKTVEYAESGGIDSTVKRQRAADALIYPYIDEAFGGVTRG